MKGFGHLPPRYSFILNHYEHERLSSCPTCRKPMHDRKFALLVHIEDFGFIILGKTCRYCTPCELIIVHQHELEAELAYKFETLAPKKIGNEYFVMGTVDKKIWQAGLKNPTGNLGDIRKHTADFKEVLELTIDPGGWRPANQ